MSINLDPEDVMKLKEPELMSIGEQLRQTFRGILSNRCELNEQDLYSIAYDSWDDLPEKIQVAWKEFAERVNFRSCYEEEPKALQEEFQIFKLKG